MRYRIKNNRIVEAEKIGPETYPATYPIEDGWYEAEKDGSEKRGHAWQVNQENDEVAPELGWQVDWDPDLLAEVARLESGGKK